MLSHTSAPTVKQRGFTLVELLTVIAIIALLAALLFPVFSTMQRTAHSATTLNNLREVGSAASKYAAERDGQYFGNGFDYPKNWITEFWSYVYPNVPNPAPEFSPTQSGSVYKGTVFYSPLMEKTPVYGGQPRSFGYNYPLEQKHGQNLRYGVLVADPGMVALFGDTKTSGSWTPAQVNARYKDSVHVSFLDQHVALVPKDRIPMDTTAPFWEGTSLE